MSIKMGPVLGFRGCENGQWRICAITVLDSVVQKPELQWGNNLSNVVTGRQLKVHRGMTLWLHEWSVPQTKDQQNVEYCLVGGKWQFVVPGKQQPLRFAYASCNGFSSLSAMKKIDEKNERWQDMLIKHEAAGFHLLLMGGDQIYADSIWETVSSIKAWSDKSRRERQDAPFTQEMESEVEKFYFNLYCERWTTDHMRDAFAKIPSLMMWDDHDIFDGWGSYDAKIQASFVFQGIFKYAKEHFRLFQLKTSDAPPGHIGSEKNFTYAFNLGDTAVVIPDLRSERTEDRVMSSEIWDKVFHWIDNLNGCSHLFVLSSIPIVYPGFGILEGILGVLPGQQELEDDLKDHWTSRSHRGERLRFIHRLLSFSESKQCRVTILSGDVHVAALGVIESTRSGVGSEATVITQLIASGIVHPPPPALALYFLKTISGNLEKVDRGITAEMTEFPGNNFKFVGARNWLSLTIDSSARLWAEWYAEGEQVPYTKVVHSLKKTDISAAAKTEVEHKRSPKKKLPATRR